MNAVLKVARLHLVDRFTYTWLVWGVLAFTLLVNIAVFAMVPAKPSGNWTGGVAAVFAFMAIAGVLSMTRFLAFAFALGISRRTYFIGTVLLAVGTSVIDAVLLTIFRAIESATNGWGLKVQFFRVPWILSGGWYESLLIYFVLLAFSFLAGMWFGLVYSRFKLPGMVLLAAAIVLVLLATSATITWIHGWAAFGRFFSGLHVAGVVGALAVVGVVLVVGGYATIRHITV